MIFSCFRTHAILSNRMYSNRRLYADKALKTVYVVISNKKVRVDPQWHAPGTVRLRILNETDEIQWPTINNQSLKSYHSNSVTSSLGVFPSKSKLITEELSSGTYDIGTITNNIESSKLIIGSGKRYSNKEFLKIPASIITVWSGLATVFYFFPS